MEFNKSLREKTKQANDVVMKFLPEEEGFPKLLLEAMNYSMRSGGKRLRPLLMQETYRVFGERIRQWNRLWRRLRWFIPIR